MTSVTRALNAPDVSQVRAAADFAITEYCVRGGVNPAFALMVGSIPVGLANSQSDIDVYLVLLDSPERVRGGETYANQFFHDGKRVDIEAWTIQDFNRQVSSVVAALRTAQSRVHSLGEMSSSDFDFLSRLVTAKPIMGESLYSSWVASHLPRDDEYAQVLSSRFALEAAATLEDVQGFADVGDLDSLGFSSARATTFAVKSWVAAAGDVYFVDKYAFAQAARQGMPAEQLERARRFGQYRWIREPSPQFAEFRSFIQDVLIASQILGTIFPASEDLSARGFTSDHMPIRIGDGVLLNEEGKRHVLLAQPAAVTWQSLIRPSAVEHAIQDFELIQQQLEDADVVRPGA